MEFVDADEIASTNGRFKVALSENTGLLLRMNPQATGSWYTTGDTISAAWAAVVGFGTFRIDVGEGPTFDEGNLSVYHYGTSKGDRLHMIVDRQSLLNDTN